MAQSLIFDGNGLQGRTPSMSEPMPAEVDATAELPGLSPIAGKPIMPPF